MSAKEIVFNIFYLIFIEINFYVMIFKIHKEKELFIRIFKWHDFMYFICLILLFISLFSFQFAYGNKILASLLNLSISSFFIYIFVKFYRIKKSLKEEDLN